MPINSRRKGKVGELNAVKFLKSLGFHDAQRTAQHCGRDGQVGDVACPETLPSIHIECKVTSNVVGLGLIGLTKAVEQAQRDAPAGSFPVVLWRITGRSADYNLTWLDRQREVRLTVDRPDDVAATLRWLDLTAGGG